VPGEPLNSAAHARECGLERILLKVQPRQPQVIGMAKPGVQETAGVERLQKFVVAQMGRGQNKRHKTDYDRFKVGCCRKPHEAASITAPRNLADLNFKAVFWRYLKYSCR